jgi:hypothetical protein
MRIPVLSLLILSALALAGCVGPLDPDPFNRPGNWAMNAAPLENTAQQADDKADLIQGKSDNTSNGVAATAAIDQALGEPTGTAAGLQKAPQTISFSAGS